MKRRRIHGRLLLTVIGAGLPGVLVSVVLLSESPLSSFLRTLLTVVVVGTWLGLAWTAHTRSRFHLRTVSNLLAALREGDFSFRLRRGDRADPFNEVIVEINALAERMRRERVDDLEATALVRKVMGEIDVAVFAFDAARTLRMVNRAGERLLDEEATTVLGRTAAELGLEECLAGAPARTLSLRLAGPARRWEMRRGLYRQHGRPHQLLVLSDVSRALREEELTAWKRLIRVIGHELNNSLAPIKSIAGSMSRLAAQEPLPEDWRDDMERGLGVISSRAEALNRFMSAYSRLAKMPEPTLGRVHVSTCVRRVAALETRVGLTVREGAEVVVQADQDQLEQLLINLVRNAVDASLEGGGGVTIGWSVREGRLEVTIEDQGPGLSDTSNLFVPFYTTKRGGSGIGLFLCRQIAEAHGGSITLGNRRGGSGCVARLVLPGATPAGGDGDTGADADAVPAPDAGP